MSKIYFIGSPYMGCNYVRVLLPMLANGWEGSISSLSKPRKSPQQIAREAVQADIVVFHRPDTVEHAKLAIELKKMGKKIVFENDDTFKDQDPMFKDKYDDLIKMKNNLADNFIRNADLVTTTTKFLAREYKKLNKNVAVLPNCVDPIDWRIPKRNEGNKVRIGIVGSVVYYNDFEIIKDFIKELSERDDVELVVFGLQSKETRWSNPDTETVLAEEYAYWDSLKLEHAPWVPAKDYANTLNNLRLDMMLIPRKDNYFNRCKSNLKFLEAAMCEVPVVASSFKNGPYEELNNTIGFKVKNRAEFRAMTEMLIDNRDLRRQMGINAKEYVLKHYSIKNNAHLWAEAYAKI